MSRSTGLVEGERSVIIRLLKVRAEGADWEVLDLGWPVGRERKEDDVAPLDTIDGHWNHTHKDGIKSQDGEKKRGRERDREKRHTFKRRLVLLQ